MKTYTHPLCKVSNEEVQANKAFPLVRELNYRYGLIVLSAASPTKNDSRLYLVDERGLFAGEASHENDNYLFRSVVTCKERGSGEQRFEYYSSKLPALMGTLKREKAVAIGDDLFHANYARRFFDMVRVYDDSFDDTDKKSQFGGAHQHLLLQIVFNNRSVDSLSQESINYFKTALDTFNKVDMLADERRAQYDETFAQPIAAVCLDKTETYLVGKIRIHPKWSVNSDRNLNDSDTTITIVEPFRRVVNLLDDVPDLRHRLAISKTYIEQNPNLKDRYILKEETMFPKCTRSMNIPEIGLVSITPDRWFGSSDMDSSKQSWAFFL